MALTFGLAVRITGELASSACAGFPAGLGDCQGEPLDIARRLGVEPHKGLERRFCSPPPRQAGTAAHGLPMAFRGPSGRLGQARVAAQASLER